MDILGKTNTDPHRDWVVGALIPDRGRLYFHRRTFQRKLFPGCWDIVGGHVEAGETVLEALRREILEETGWELVEVEAPILELDWTAETPEGPVLKREFDFVVRVEGDLDRPRLEDGKHDRFEWISPDTLPILMENRQPDDAFIIDLAKKGFAYLDRGPRATRSDGRP